MTTTDPSTSNGTSTRSVDAGLPAMRRRDGVELAPEFPVLDTLRAIGAVCVVTTHTSFQAGDYLRHGIFGSILSRLDVGVAIFFVLSGFLLARPHLARAALGLPRPSVRRYYWKRFLRIYPLYAVTVVLALGLIDENRGIGSRGWVRSLLLGDAYTMQRLPQGLTQMWSLAVEVAFYVALPGLMVLLLGRRPSLHPGRLVLGLVAMLAVSVAWHGGLGEQVARHSAGSPMTWLPAYLTWFAVGMGLAWAHVRGQSGAAPAPVRALTALAAQPGACWVIATGLLLVAATPLGGPTLLIVPTAAESLTKHLLYAAIGGLVVLTGVFAWPAGRYAAAMSAAAPRHLGQISYGIFCIHLPVLHLVMAVGGFELFRGRGLEIWALTLPLSLVAAEVLHRLVEQPALRLRGAGRASSPGPDLRRPQRPRRR